MTLPLRIAACLALSGLLAVAAAADSRSAVEQAERNWAAAVVKADTVALEKLLAADLVYTHFGGNRDTRASFIETARTGKLKCERLTTRRSTSR